MKYENVPDKSIQHAIGEIAALTLPQ